MSSCEGFPTFREINLSPYSGYAGRLVEPKLISFGSTKRPSYLDASVQENFNLFCRRESFKKIGLIAKEQTDHNI